MSRGRLALIAAVSLAARVVYVVTFMRGYMPTSDADSYFKIGRAVSRGQGYVFTLPFAFVHPTAIRPPLYPTILAGAFRILGTHVGVGQGINIVAGCAVAVLGALIATRISGPRAGMCAGLVIALYPPLIANDVTLLVESIAVLLIFSAVLLLLDGRTVLAGISLGLLMLDRASAQWLLLVIAGWVLWRFGWRQALRLVVVALLVATPWVVRNAVHVGGPVLVTTNGFNINATYSNEARHARQWADAYFDPRFAIMRINATDEVQLDRQLRAKGLRDLRAHPAELFRVARFNLEHWFELRPSSNRPAEAQDGRNLTVREWTLPLFYVVTAAGLFALFRARRAAAAQLLALAAAYFTIVCLVSISVPRLRSIFDACLAVGAGITLAWAIERRTTINELPPKLRPMRTMRSTLVLGLVTVAVAAMALAWQADTRRQARQSVRTAVARDASAIDALASQYRAGRSANKPPELRRQDLDRVGDLVTVLGDRTPEVAANLRSPIAGALRSVQIAAHEAQVVSLLSVAQDLDAAAHHRTPSLETVRTRYEREVRSRDPSLEPWADVVSGASLVRARSALHGLHPLR